MPARYHEAFRWSHRILVAHESPIHGRPVLQSIVILEATSYHARMTGRRSPLDFDEPARAHTLDTLERELLGRDMLAPLQLGGPDERAWMDCDLASFAENRLGDLTSPDVLTPGLREHWLARATTEPLWQPRARSQCERLYWLRARGQRVGTLALSAGVGHGSSVRASSLYVLPAHRHQGTAGTVLRALYDGLGRDGLVLGLDTFWTWQSAVRMYLRMGAWVHMWKRELALRFDASAPAPIIDFDGDHASLHVALDGTRIMLQQARRAGDRLVLEDPPPSEHPRAEGLRWGSSSTFALALALHGWPLVRSQADWDESCYADAGPPEALACRIMQWEAWSCAHGWLVDTPRIPGLRYPTWEALRARWARERAELEQPHPPTLPQP